jgi:PleD family two-component response regulator
MKSKILIVKPVSPPTVKASVRTHLELKSQRDALRQLSNLDGLTGIPNRRRFDEVLEDEWLRAQRHASPISILLLDNDLLEKADVLLYRAKEAGRNRFIHERLEPE